MAGVIPSDGEEVAASFDLLPRGSVLYVTDRRVAVESAGTLLLEIPLDRIESCSSRKRRLGIVWRDGGRVRASLVLDRMPAAAAESAVFAAAGAGGTR